MFLERKFRGGVIDLGGNVYRKIVRRRDVKSYLL
jgi:hypothetical protein